LQIGKLDQWVTLSSPLVTNSLGSVSETYSDVATVRARIISEKGTEAFESARVNAREKIRVQMRYRSDVTNKWRLAWLGQYYNVIVTDRSLKRDGEIWLTAELVGAL
jgi:SPP1 family predicted phage head-tail adaptor